MHSRVVLLLKKQQSTDVRAYAPCRLLHVMDNASQQTVERKFNIAFLIAKENMARTKMKAICELEERHGVDLGTAYKNNQACATFVEYIAKEQQQVLARALSEAKFYSFQCDGTTDCGNAEDELILAVYFDGNADDKKVHVRNPFFTSVNC